MNTLKPTVVVDSSSFMRLELRPQYFSFYEKLFEQVLIPEEVGDELVRRSTKTPEQYLKEYHLTQIVSIIKPVSLENFVTSRVPPLDKGEAEVISLAYQRGIAAAIEEKRGRNFANQNGVRAANLAAFAVRGYKYKYVTKVEAEEMVQIMYEVNMYSKMLRDVFFQDIASFSE